jgi:hypothetical protein
MDGYKPLTYGPVVNVGTAAVTAVPPSLGAGGGTIGGGTYGGDDSSPGIAGAANLAHAQIASQNPWSFALSPLPMALIFLVVSLVGLRVIHWR